MSSCFFLVITAFKEILTVCSTIVLPLKITISMGFLFPFLVSSMSHVSSSWGDDSKESTNFGDALSQYNGYFSYFDFFGDHNFY